MEILTELQGIALFTLRYGGLITITIGMILWGISKKSTEKSKKGVWLLYCGAFMLIFYFGYSSFISLLHFLFDFDM